MFDKLIKLIIDNNIKVSIERDEYEIAIITFSKDNYCMKRVISSLEVSNLNLDIGIIVITALEEFVKEYNTWAENNSKKKTG